MNPITSHSGCRDDADGAVDPVLAAPPRGPPAGRATSRTPPVRWASAGRWSGCVSNSCTGPRVEVVAEGPGLHPVPLHARDRARVADELAGRALRDVRREELRRLDLLGDDRGLGLGAGARRVVAREREEHDEAEQHREPGGQHAEHARRPVAVVEVAAVRCLATDEQHGADGGSRPDDDDRDGDDGFIGRAATVRRR